MRAYSRREFVALSAAVAGAARASSPASRNFDGDVASLTLKRASELLRTKAVSATELTRACFDRIDRYNPALNAFVTINDGALDTAQAHDRELRRGHRRGPLHGIPIALKDNFDTAGLRTTAASAHFKDRVPTEDADVVRRFKDAGAIILGKLNLHEFAFGGTSAVSYFGPVRNPWGLDRTPGGSSGGSACAMAAGLCFASTGTDTAGSIRIPAAYCGVVGLKPTYGRVSTRGVIPLSWSLDHVGPICRTVEDTALTLQVMAGYDDRDPASVDRPVPDYLEAVRASPSGLRVGLPRTPFFDGIDREIANAADEAIAVLRRLVARVSDVKLPDIPTQRPILRAEAYSYHAERLKANPDLYDPFTRTLLESGAQTTAAEYARALRQMQMSRREIKTVFAQVDVLVTPTMPDPPMSLEEGRTRNTDGRDTAPFDVLGLPAISVPCGFTASGLPIGLQMVGAPFAESTVLTLASAYERATEWHRRSPPATSAPAQRR